MSYLEKTFSVRREELLPASLLAGYLMLVMGCFTMGKSVADSLYLSEYPNTLSRIILASAFVIAIFITIFLRLSRRIRPQKLMPGLLLFFSGSYLVFSLLAHFHQKWVYIPTYLWVYTAGVMCPTMGWTLANYVLTTREARRVFGLIGTGPILGGAFAGFLTAAVGKRIPTETMLFALAVLNTIAVLPMISLFRRTPQRLTALAAATTGNGNAPRSFIQACRLILGSRYLQLITALILVSCVCSTIADFQFKTLASIHFSGDKESLSAFFGHFYGWIGLGSFLLQLILTGHLMRTFGIRVTLFILPMVFLAGSTGVLLLPSLLSATLLRGSYQTLRYSIDKSSLELLYLPVPPELKANLKPFIDSFVWRVADGIAGLVLILFSEVLRFAPHRLSLIAFVFLAGWMFAAHLVRKEYLTVLREAIQRRALDPEKTAAGILDQSTTRVLAGFLESGDSRQVLYGLSLFDLGQEPAWHPYLRALLDHPSAAVRRRALELLCDGGDKNIVEKAEALVRDESSEVRGEALRYLVVQAHRDPVDLLGQGHPDIPDYSVQVSIVAYLLKLESSDAREGALFILEQMLARQDKEGAPARAAAARVLGSIPPPFPMHSELGNLLHDEDPEVIEQAIISVGRIRAREFLPGMLQTLQQPRLAHAAVDALAHYGERILGTLHDYLNDEAVPFEVRRHIPQVLARINNPESVQVLTDSVIQGNPGLRFEVLKALNRLRRHEPALVPPAPAYENLLIAEALGHYRSWQILAVLLPRSGKPLPSGREESLVIRVVRERMSLELERIFLLLALLYPQRDILNAYYGLTSRRPQLQANSLEVLEHLLKPEIYRDLAGAIDPDLSLDDKAAHAERLCRTTVKTKCEALRILLHSEDRWLRLCAVYELGEKCMPDLWEDLHQLVQLEDPLFRETWNWTIERLSQEGSI